MQWSWYLLSIYVPIEDVLRNPEMPWSKWGLSSNRDITLDIKRRIDAIHMPNTRGMGWDWYDLSTNVPIEDVLRNPDLPWDRRGLSKNEGITIDIKNRLDSMYMPDTGREWVWLFLSITMPIEDVLLHPDLPWNREGLSWNEGITLDAKRRLDNMPRAREEWSWRYLSRHVPIEDVLRNPDLRWSRKGLSKNKNLTIDAKNMFDDMHTPDAWEGWHWEHISRNVPIEDVPRNPDEPWDRRGLSLNKSLTIDIKEEIDAIHMPRVRGRWQWFFLSVNVPTEDVLRNPTLPWDREGLSLNPGITINLKNKIDNMHTPHIQDDWDWDFLSRYVPIEDVVENPGLPWDRQELSWNKSLTIDAKNRLDTMDMPRTQGDWHWPWVQKHIPIEDVFRYPSLEWNRNSLSWNNGITMDAVNRIDNMDTLNIQGDWYWEELSQNIPMEDVRQNPSLEWEKKHLSLNPGITIEDVKYL